MHGAQKYHLTLAAEMASLAIGTPLSGLAPEQLRPAVDLLLQTDVALKSSGGDAKVLLDRLVVELCAGKRARGGPPRRW